MDEPQKATEQKPGQGIDRTVIRQLLALTPAERIHQLVREARNLDALDAKMRRR